MTSPLLTALTFSILAASGLALMRSAEREGRSLIAGLHQVIMAANSVVVLWSIAQMVRVPLAAVIWLVLFWATFELVTLATDTSETEEDEL